MTVRDCARKAWRWSGIRLQEAPERVLSVMVGDANARRDEGAKNSFARTTSRFVTHYATRSENPPHPDPLPARPGRGGTRHDPIWSILQSTNSNSFKPNND